MQCDPKAPLHLKTSCVRSKLTFDLPQYNIVFVLDQYIPAGAQSASDIVEHVERLVASGVLAPEHRLPPIRNLAEATGLAPNTVAAAYRVLSSRGVVVGRGRNGTFIAHHVGSGYIDAPVPEGLVDLATGNPDRRLLPDLAPYLSRIDTVTVLYGESPVDPILEVPARRVLESMGVHVDRLAVVNGALDGVERSLQAHLRVGDAVAIEAPGWPAFADLVTAIGMRPVPVEVDDRGMIPERLATVADQVAAVVMTPRFQNPTGAAVDAGRAGRLRLVLDSRPELLVVEDDHGGLISGVPLALCGPGRARWAYVQSVSKSLGPDLRLALLTGDEHTVSRIVGRQSAGPGWVSHLIQRLVAAILEDPATPGLLADATRAYDERRAGLGEALTRRRIEWTGRAGINLWVRVPEEEPVVAALAMAGFAVRAGDRWRLGTGPAIRVSIGSFEPDMTEPVADAIVAGSTPQPRSKTRSG